MNCYITHIRLFAKDMATLEATIAEANALVSADEDFVKAYGVDYLSFDKAWKVLAPVAGKTWVRNKKLTDDDRPHGDWVPTDKTLVVAQWGECERLDALAHIETSIRAAAKTYHVLLAECGIDPDSPHETAGLFESVYENNAFNIDGNRTLREYLNHLDPRQPVDAYDADEN